MRSIVAVYCVFMCVLCLSNAIKSRKLLLTVYYESNCPDSKSFILKQLEPALQFLHYYVNVNLIPFGKAKSINYGNDGFKCQHGEPECLGNIIQDCALNLMMQHSDRMKVAYVACEMKTKASVKGYLGCVEKANLPANRVEHCAVADHGVNLQLQSEYYTSLVAPKFIPTVTIDDVYDQQIQDNAQVDLIGTLCSILKDAHPCAGYYNSMALNYVLVNQR